MNKSTSVILTALLVTGVAASLVASSVVFLADSADADRGDKIKGKVKKALEKIKERIGWGGGGDGSDNPGRP